MRLILGLVCIAAVGCAAQREQREYPTTQAVDDIQEVQEQEFRAPRTVSPVAQGPAPLVYAVNGPGPVRIVDLATNKTLAQQDVPGGTIVSIDAETGIRFGTEQVVRGPLTSDRQYGIYLDREEKSVLRSGIERSSPQFRTRHVEPQEKEKKHDLFE